MIRIFVNKTLPLTIHKNTVCQCRRWVERDAQKTFVHVDGARTYAEAHLNTPTGIVWVANGHGARFCQFRRIALHHFLIHDETARTEHHTLAGTVASLFHVLANHETHNPLLRAKLIDNQAQCPRFKVNVDVPLLDRLSQYFHE